LDGRVSREWLEEEHPLDQALAGGQPDAAPQTPVKDGESGETKSAEL
jgi:hypothetical protein